jgi:hypothetical protein
METEFSEEDTTMKPFNIKLFLYRSGGDYYLKFKKKVRVQSVFEVTQLVFIIAIAVLLLLEHISPFSKKGAENDFPARMGDLLVSTKSTRDPSVRDVLHLANVIRFITDDQLSESKVLRYSGLINHASQKYGVNPLEIIALIMAESNFKEDSINRETGDYGLGQINWEHWGKDYGYTPQQLLDPSINIFLTCHVYHFFEKDFGKYHRGNGIQSRAYLVNVKSILSTLSAFSALNKEDVS